MRTGRPFAIFSPGDVVRVPFPYVEREQREVRPAVVISQMLDSGMGELFWCVMVTSAQNRGWPDDISLEDRYQDCGLKVPCVIRTAKIATIETDRASKLGELPSDVLAALRTRIAGQLGI